jgi:hypothetical protein
MFHGAAPLFGWTNFPLRFYFVKKNEGTFCGICGRLRSKEKRLPCAQAQG